MLEVKTATARDSIYIHNMDLKTHEDVWSAEEWDQINQSKCSIYVCYYLGRPISFMVLSPHIDSLHIAKLGTIPYRCRMGAASLLVGTAVDIAENQRMSKLTCTVSEFKLEKDSPTRYFLEAHDFKAVYTLPGQLEMYGSNFDQYLFEKKINAI